ncbi:MAG: T9SS type A sorting domain-containing protein [Bacteroidetes bacterium]|nr:T9SS type A sorting domain-containing protein [Bacteroidota bacterium]
MKKLYILFFFAINFFQVNAQPFYSDAAGTFYNKCTSCHHPGGGTPFSMMNYSETSPWCALIQADVNKNKMAPWPPDTNYTRFLHERVLTASEKNKILNWTSNGCQQGDTTKAPFPPPTYPIYKLCGTPDTVLQIPTYTSTASSSDMYNCFSLPTGLTQTEWLRAYELIPGNPNIVHHVVMFVDTVGSSTSNLTGSCFTPPSGSYQMGAWAPGSSPTVFPGLAPLKAGMKINAGSKIVLQIHYPAGTAGQVDSTKIRLYFYPTGSTGIRRMYSTVDLQKWGFQILPNTTPTLTQTVSVTSTRSIFAVFPHSHLICDSIAIYATSGINTTKLVRVNKWDFKWQGFYTFPFMPKIPSGYVLNAVHRYNNTSSNPNNPYSPPQTIYSGYATTDEMLFDGFLWLNYQTGDENIDIGALLANDTLLNCTPPPYAMFSESADTICAGSCINFSDQSNNSPTYWNWNFQGGNPSSSAQQNPQNICYANAGIYNVTLTSGNVSGSTTNSKTITVLSCTGTNEKLSSGIFSYAQPNPFFESSRIIFSLPVAAFTSVEIYNMYGDKMKTIFSGGKNAGTHSAEWNGTNDAEQKVSAGIYFYNIRAMNFSSCGKILLSK